MKWIVSEMFYPDEVSTALIMTEIAEKYAEDGKVGIICGPKGYEKSYKQQNKIINSNIDIHRVNVKNFDKNKIISRVMRLILLTIKMAFKVASKIKREDEVLVVTNPIFLLIPIAFLKFFLKFKLNILVHDVFPDNLIPAKLISKNSIKFKILNKLFNWAYRKADNLIVLGEDMAEIMVNKLHIYDHKIKVIPNWYDLNVFSIPNFNCSEYYDIDLNNKIVLGFAGNIGRVQGISQFIECFIEAANESLVLILIGDGAMKKDIEKDIADKNAKDIFLIGSKSRDEQNDFLNACDIALITLSEGMKGLGVPSKTYNIMAVGKPILYIGDKTSEVDNYIKKYNNGWSFDWKNRDALLIFLKSLKVADKEQFFEKGLRSFRDIRTDFHKENILELFNNID